MISIGQGLYLKLDFADGGVCEYKRPFLVIDKNDSEIKLLNISSLEGKEWKLAMDSNKNIVNYNPPFIKRSFAKIDSVYIIPNHSCIREALLCEGRRMHPRQINDIKNARNSYNETNEIIEKSFDIDELRRLNSNINRSYAMAT